MTVATQVRQVLSNLKGCQANLETFALQTQNQQAKDLYTHAARQTKSIVDLLQSRVTAMEQEEPQYQGF